MSVTSARRTAIDRWIIGLTPLVNAVASVVSGLSVGEPRVSIGPAFMGKHLFDGGGDRIRKGAVWWIKDLGNCGFHVDFLKPGGVIIESWTGRESQIRAAFGSPLTPVALARSLGDCLSLSGLADLNSSIGKAHV